MTNQQFVASIKRKLKFKEPEELHKLLDGNIVAFVPTENGYVRVIVSEMERLGWRRK